MKLKFFLINFFVIFLCLNVISCGETTNYSQDTINSNPKELEYKEKKTDLNVINLLKNEITTIYNEDDESPLSIVDKKLTKDYIDTPSNEYTDKDQYKYDIDSYKGTFLLVNGEFSSEYASFSNELKEIFYVIDSYKNKESDYEWINYFFSIEGKKGNNYFTLFVNQEVITFNETSNCYKYIYNLRFIKNIYIN
ncbi:hypothetical protein [Spiroplasma turonicum]|uniref:Lipoprotein n=1 Tax=Spiroplasma turonicum TaxID=216946 RepID=A0A0K1P6M1_9MOLU|nr:hypothetical protein [Spiroplasma turonicum]AKU79930.1 hypothetical protein STURON_00684 [Spiroplasma turonicum]ALX70944.1 hypothetical protein STURO_v1c06850 [Spiroplasma turonicum]